MKLAHTGPEMRADLIDGEVVFTGSVFGPHYMTLEISSPWRVLAHWDGYCENGRSIFTRAVSP